MNTSELRPLSRIFILTCLVIVIVGAALSLADLGKQSLWLDEAFTWSFVRLNWPRAIQAIRADAVNPPFYYLFVKALTSGVALNEAVLRFPSALAQIIGIVAVSLADRAQGVKETKRDDAPTVPEQCIQKDEWQSSSGVRAWEIQCPANCG